MIKAINAGNKNELRKLLKMYSQPIYQRALSKAGTTEAAKEITRNVLTYITICASTGSCREDVDNWLMSVTDTQTERYISEAKAKEILNQKKQSYFTAPTVAGTAPSTNAYAKSHSQIYKNTPSAPAQQENGSFVPFSPTLTIPERPEFTERHNSGHSEQHRTTYVAPPQVTIPPTQTSAQFTPPQYVPPQYNPPTDSSVINEIKSDTTPRQQYNEFNQTAMHNTQVNSTPVVSAPTASADNIIPIPLREDELEREIKGSSAVSRQKQKPKKKGSFFNSGVIIAVICIILMLVVGFLIAEIVGILITS